MVLMVSGRTDIVAFYSEWFMNRYREGFVDVRNPFNPKMVNRISFDDVDLIMFCSKNPLPIIPFLKEIKKPIIFHITLTGYNKDIEPGVIDKKKVIEGIKKISDILGKENVVVRYDPIFLSNKYNLEYHKKVFDKMCKLLNGYIERIIVSFMDEGKNAKNNRNILNYRDFSNEDYKVIGESFSKSAKENGMVVQTCFEDINLVEYGFVKGECLSHELAYKLTGKSYPNWKARKEQKCNCVQMVDIGVYNSCKHFCKYCYANFDEKKVLSNYKNYNPSSSLLIGKLDDDDVIKQRYK